MTLTRETHTSKPARSYDLCKECAIALEAWIGNGKEVKK